jgi:hypothetical protein
MPKRISVATHLSIEELEQRYRQAKDGIESRQYQIIWLVAQGKKTEEVKEITGYSRTALLRGSSLSSAFFYVKAMLIKHCTLFQL